MTTAKSLSILFIVAALYDGLLGIIFLIAGLPLYALFGVAPPNHVGYIQFPAMLLIIFGAMFWQIAMDPFKYRSLIRYGIGLKLAFCTTVFGHWIFGGIPTMWKPFAVADLIFLILFVWACRTTRPATLES
jgi:hypothetical protein